MEPIALRPSLVRFLRNWAAGLAGLGATEDKINLAG
jgi:hypothetical protein